MVVMRLLVLGDTHIPRRASRIPEEFDRLFKELEYDAVVCTGDLTDKSVLDYLKGLGELHVVRGNMDHLPLPETAVIDAEVKVGVLHGDQVYPRGDREQLQDLAAEMKVDVLISGHTHSPDVFKGRAVLLNPGSATGVWGGGGGAGIPSFMLVDVGDKIDVTLFRLRDRVVEERFEIKL